MPICACGCDKETKGGDFCPGHDQTLRTQLGGKIGGLLSLSKLVEVILDYDQDLISLADLGQQVKSILSKS